MRTVSLLALGMGVVLALPLKASFCQEGEPSTCDEACQEQLKSLWQEAKHLAAILQYEAAAKRYQQISEMLPASPKSQKASLKAALCMVRAGKLSEAVALYDRVVTLGEAATSPRSRSRDSVRYWTRLALLNQALTCEQIGDVSKALGAVARLRAAFPKSPQAMSALAVKARLEELDEEQTDAALAAEQEALQICEEILQTIRRGQDADEVALARCNEVLARYPDSAAALPTLRYKALILWRNERYDESRATYQTIVDRVGKLVPHSPCVRTAEYRIAWLDAGRLLKNSIRQRRSGGIVPEEQWQKVRDLCAEVQAKDPYPHERAQASVMIIESLVWQGRFEDATRASNSFLAQYAGEKKLGRYSRDIAWGHFFAGYALQKQYRHDEAISHFRFIVKSAQCYVSIAADDVLLSHALFREWQSLRDMKAEEDQVSTAASNLVSRFPQSELAAYVRRASEEVP